jgi:hydroxymethylbilane synthase
VLAVLEAGCSAPIGAYAAGSTGHLQLEAAVIATDGSQSLRERGSDDPAAAEQLGRRIANRLLGSGAAMLIATPGRTNGTDA